MSGSESAGRPSERTQSVSGRKLEELFETYLKSAVTMEYPANWRCHAYCNSCRDDLYAFAGSLLEGSTVAVEDAHGLLSKRELNELEKKCAGFFLSAIYNKSGVKDIVYDLEAKVPNLAYKLLQDKAFINKGNGYDYSGTQAAGIIINYVENKDLTSITAGFAGSGPVVTYGSRAYSDYEDDDGETIETVPLKVSFTKELVICGIHGDPIIDNNVFINPNRNRYARNIILKEEIDGILELRGYVDALKATFEQGRRDYRIVLDVLRGLGAQPQERIKQDITDILRRADYHAKTA